jgi:hypothetical protein
MEGIKNAQDNDWWGSIRSSCHLNFWAYHPVTMFRWLLMLPGLQMALMGDGMTIRVFLKQWISYSWWHMMNKVKSLIHSALLGRLLKFCVQLLLTLNKYPVQFIWSLSSVNLTVNFLCSCEPSTKILLNTFFTQCNLPY